MTNYPNLPARVSVLITHQDDEGCLPAYIRKEAKMNWIMLVWPSVAAVLILVSAFAWLDTIKTESAVRPHIDDIPFRPNPYRHSDDDHQRR
jgi:hypothetical protein